MSDIIPLDENNVSVHDVRAGFDAIWLYAQNKNDKDLLKMLEPLGIIFNHFQQRAGRYEADIEALMMTISDIMASIDEKADAKAEEQVESEVRSILTYQGASREWFTWAIKDEVMDENGDFDMVAQRQRQNLEGLLKEVKRDLERESMYIEDYQEQQS